MRRVLTVLVVAIAAACGTFGGDDPTGSPAPTEDAAVTPTDASTASDASADAGTGFCATSGASDFCADFDTVPRFWGFEEVGSSLEPASRAALDVTQSGFVSPPNALLARANVVPGDDAGALNELLVKHVPMQASHKISYSFSLRALSGVDQAYVAVASLSLDGSRYFAVVYSQSKLTLVRSGLANVDFSRTPDPGKWSRVRIEADYDAGLVEAYLDDAPVVASSVGFTTTASDTEVAISMGLSLGSPPAIGTEVQFDDVLLKWH